VSALLLALLLWVPQEHGRAAEAADPLELFRSSCLTCHAPPDPRFAVERAWLQQVQDTA
jgi:hypothetical protein